MNDIWMKILERIAKTIIKRLEARKGKIDKQKAEKVLDYLNVLIRLLKKEIVKL